MENDWNEPLLGSQCPINIMKICGSARKKVIFFNKTSRRKKENLTVNDTDFV